MLSVKTALTQAGINWEYFNGHSFRVETAKSANQAVAESTRKYGTMAEHGLSRISIFGQQTQH